MSSLAERLVESYGRLTPANRSWLVDQGVPPLAIDMYPGPIGRHDETTYMQPIYSDGRWSDIIGTVAWRQSNPSKFWIVDGDQDLDVLGLGQHFLLWAVDHRGSLAVTASPLEWLRHYGATFCPLNWGKFAVEFEMMHCRKLIAIPPEFGRELRRRLDQARPQLPTIRVQA